MYALLLYLRLLVTVLDTLYPLKMTPLPGYWDADHNRPRNTKHSNAQCTNIFISKSPTFSLRTSTLLLASVSLAPHRKYTTRQIGKKTRVAPLCEWINRRAKCLDCVSVLCASCDSYVSKCVSYVIHKCCALASGVPTGLHSHSWLRALLLPLLHGWHPETRHLVLLYPGKFVTPIDTVSAGGWLVCHAAGLVCHAAGLVCHAAGLVCHAAGLVCHAAGLVCHAAGLVCHAAGLVCHAAGLVCHAAGLVCHAAGLVCHAAGLVCHAAGLVCHAAGLVCHAAGLVCHAAGLVCHAAGLVCHAAGLVCHAAGLVCHAAGLVCHAAGLVCHAAGLVCHAAGLVCHAAGLVCHAAGLVCHAAGLDCHAAGLVSLKVCFLFKGVCNVIFFTNQI